MQAGEWFAAAPLGLSAPDAAAFAVDGFWELQKILLLNFGVLAGVHFLGRAPLPKALAAVFCGFGLAFAALAAGKLAVYVVLYGLTPRRVIAGWFLGVLYGSGLREHETTHYQCKFGPRGSRNR